MPIVAKTLNLLIKSNMKTTVKKMFMLILEVEEENMVRVENQSKSGSYTKGGAKAGQKQKYELLV